MWRTILLW